jgi:Flp pilus assembly protein TadB
MLLFTTHAGNAILIGSLLYMSIGVFVMAQMIKFDI